MPPTVDRADAFDVAIVTPTYISSNPRVVKEADALAAAGLRVAVVFSQGPMAWARADDDAVAAGRQWRAHAMRWSPTGPIGEQYRYAWSTARYHLARRLPLSARGPLSLVSRAECRTYPELATAAAAVPARLYIAHYPEGLMAAARAARRHNAQYAFDAEDLHAEEDAPTRTGLQRSARVHRIERRHLGGCVYVSAVSQGVARALADRYPGVVPFAVHNAFAWSDRATIDGDVKDRRGPDVSIYWYSQVIGFDRGLEDAVRALGHVTHPFQLHVRGFHTSEVARQIRALAEGAGIADRVFLHGRVPPGELLSRTVEHDIGLALEQPVSRSRELSVSNKLFFYLLAGLAVVATDLPGQRTILRSSEACDLYRPGDYLALAGILNSLLADGALLAARKAAALAAARSRWNWESEQQTLVDAVGRAMRRRAA